MNKTLFLITALLAFAQALHAQNLDKRTIDEKLHLKNDAVYVVNGLPYEQKDSLKMDSVLKYFPINHLVELTKLRNDGGIIRCTTNDVAIIYFAKQQNKIHIKEKLKEIQEIFPDKYYGFSQHILTDSKNPVLIIDNNTIHHTEANKLIENLRVNKIFYIDYRIEPQALEYYGQNAKNGLVRIWTK